MFEYLPNFISLFQGFLSSCALSEWDALICLTTEREREIALTLEVFDEFEELHNKCCHYVVAVSGNHFGSTWLNSLCLNDAIILKSNVFFFHCIDFL